MFFRKEINIIKLLFSFEIRRFKYYKKDAIINVFSKFIYLLLNLLFWYVINSKNYKLPGWSYNNVIVFIAFSELFYGLNNAFFSMASRFWYYIYNAILDNTLTRPLDPRVRFIILNIDYVEIILTFLEFIFLLIVSNTKISITSVLFGVIIVIMANIVLSLIRLCGSYFAFWHGKMSAICEVSDALTSFNKYPLTIMPPIIIYIFKFLVPFYFFSTFSAEIVCNLVGIKTISISIAGMIINIILWLVINNIIWKKGLERYESING